MAERVRAFAGGVDHIVDVDFGGNLATSLRVLKDNASLVGYATNGDRTPQVPFQEIMRKNLTVHGMILPTSPLEARHRAQADISSWLQTRPILSVAARFPLAQTIQAHEDVERGDKKGTVVVEPA